MKWLTLAVFTLVFGSLDGNGNGALPRSRHIRAADDDCSFNFTVSGSGGTITSPGYPDKYPSSVECRWLLRTTDPNVTIFLRIDTLNIEPDAHCKLDYLQVYLGSSTLAPSMNALCGNIKDQVIKSNSSTLLLVFHSDPVYEDKGFSIDYFTQTAGDCQEFVNESTGVIRSPGFPSDYFSNTDCRTLIKTQAGKKVVLHFESLDLEYGENCTFDYVQVFDGATRESPLLGQICRQLDVTTFESSSESLLIHFHSDESVNKKGFRARYSTIDKKSTMIGDCLWDNNPNSGMIASPNYPSHYSSMSNCSIWLLAPEGSWVVIEFEALQLELEANCSYDYLQIKEGPPSDSKLLGTFCGRKKEPKNLTSSSNEVEILFRSDDFAEFSGFKLRYRFANNQTVETTTAPARWTPNEKLTFSTAPENATLSVGSSYVMGCSTRNPLAKIRWLKGDHFLAGVNPLPGLKALGNGSLLIQSMDNSLAGQYTCVVVTSEETVSASAYVMLENGARNIESECGVVFRKVPRDSSFAEGEFAHLECLAAGGHVEVTWEKDGVTLTSNSRTTILKNGFLFVDKAGLGDAGVYTCIARDQLANCSKRASAVLQVSKRADIEEICGIPRVGKPSKDVPLMEHGKIVGGHDTKKGAYPWQVMLWEPNLKSFCGGTLLNQRWIATAAHCFVNYKGLRWDQVVIKLGKHDREYEEDSESRTAIADASSVVVHPAYNKATFDNDLALIRLRDHVHFSDYILPICLMDRGVFDSSEQDGSRIRMGTVTGWGKLKEYGPSPRYLQEIRLPIVEQKLCVASTNYTVSRNMFCAGYSQEILGDACHGDSGGPLVISRGERWYLMGIVSWGEGCGMANKYGFYTKILNYLPWIKGIMKS